MTIIDSTILTSNRTRVFILGPNHPYEWSIWYASYVVAHRVMIADGIARILLRGRVFKRDDTSPFDLRNFEDGMSVHITHGVSGDPSRYDADQVAFEFQNCKVRRAWYQNIGALIQEEAGAITHYIELWSDEWHLRY